MPGTKQSLTEYLRLQLAVWEGDDEHLEIASHRIEQLSPGIIQYNFLPKSGQPWIRGLGINCPEEQIEEFKERLLGRWTEPRNSKLLLPDSTSSSATTVLIASTSTYAPQAAQVGDWVHQPEAILERLENESLPEKDRLAAVLFAERKPFDGELRARLLVALHKFIEANRLTEDADRIVYLCSAVRKYAMNMGQDQFEAYCEWMLPTETTPVHHEVEMELMKALSYRLQFEELYPPQVFPNSLAIVSDIAFGYLRKSLVLQKSYANTAMLAIICIAILESLSESAASLTTELLHKVETLGIVWFEEMVEDNLDEAAGFVEQNNPSIYPRLNAVLGRR